MGWNNGDLMEVSRDDLIENFQRMDDEELLASCNPVTLTALAFEVIQEEIKRRGLVYQFNQNEFEAEVSPPSPSLEEPVVMVTITRFWNIFDANIQCQLLKSEGIPAFVADSQLLQMQPLWANAIGGVRLQVPANDVEQARRILADFAEGQLALGAHEDDVVVEEPINFYAPSNGKFLFLSIASFGMFTYYWVYKNYALLSKSRPNDRIWPFWRAVFMVFWINDFGKIVSKQALEKGINNQLPYTLFAWGVFVFNLINLLPNAWSLLVLLQVLFVMPTNELANRVQALDPQLKQDRLTPMNIVIGVVMLIVGTLGAYQTYWA